MEIPIECKLPKKKAAGKVVFQQLFITFFAINLRLQYVQTAFLYLQYFLKTHGLFLQFGLYFSLDGLIIPCGEYELEILDCAPAGSPPDLQVNLLVRHTHLP
jgi:hypothetical protein